MSAITLHITPHTDGGGWQAAWHVDDQSIAAAIEISSADFSSLSGHSRSLLDQFESGRRVLVEPAALRDLGRRMFDLWFSSVWPQLQSRLQGAHHHVLIRSPHPQILNLPWELVELNGNTSLGCDPAWSLRRTPLDSLMADEPLEPGPLRILFCAAGPIDQAKLDYEREEDAMLRATGQIRKNVVVLFAEAGSFDELAAMVVQYRPNVVHLSGHGVVNAADAGTFAFEDERGNTDSRDAGEIVARIFRGSPVRCVFLNACQTSQAAAAGLCQALAAAGVPMAIGWAASVADDRATQFAEAFYRELTAGQSIPQAAAHAREAIRRLGRMRQGTVEYDDPTFVLPQIYTSVHGTQVFDAAAPPRPYQGPRTEYTLLEDGIKGLREGFVGRRRAIQRLVPALRDGNITFAVLTGIGGAGKSTLATRAANLLNTAGFRVYGVRVPENPKGDFAAERGATTLSNIRDAIGRAFIHAQRQDLYDRLTNPKIREDQRMRLAIDGLREIRALFVLDNFEDALTLDTRAVADPALAKFYRDLSLNLTTGSRVIVTCRYLPAQTPFEEDQSNVRHLPLDDFEEHDFLKFLRRDARVDERVRTGVLRRDLLAALYDKVGGTPRFLAEIRAVLATINPDDLAEELAGEMSGGTVEVLQELYFEKIFVERLYSALLPAAQQMVSRLAISELPLPLDAVARIAELDESTAQSNLNLGVAFGLLQQFSDDPLPRLYHPPGLLRSWLGNPPRLADAAAQRVHGQLSEFWMESIERDRAKELRIPYVAEFRACRNHGRLGQNLTTYVLATLRLAQILHHFSEWTEARELLEQIAQEDRTAACWSELAYVELSLGDWSASRRHFEHAMTMQPDMSEEIASTWHNLASIDMSEGNYGRAREKFWRSMAIKQAIGDRAGEAVTWHQLATIDLHEGNYASARENCGKSMEIMQVIGDQAGEAAAWKQFASIDLNEGNYELARENCGKSMAIRRTIGDRAGEATTWHELASIDMFEGHYATAREKLGKSMAIMQDIGDLVGEGAGWHNLATIDVNGEDYASARDKFGKSMAIKQAIGDRAGEAATWHNLATIDLRERKYTSARDKFGKSMAINQAIGDRAGEAATWHQLASIDLHEGECAAAREKSGKSMAIMQAIGDRAGEAATWRQFGHVAWNTGHRDAAVRLFGISWLIDKAIGHGEAEMDLKTVLHSCGELNYTEQQVNAAIEEAATAYATDRGAELLQKALHRAQDTPS